MFLLLQPKGVLVTQPSSINPEDIVAALGRGSLFPEGSAGFELFAPYIGRLVDIVGEGYMDDPVGLGNLSDVTARLLDNLVNDEGFVQKATPKMVTDFVATVDMLGIVVMMQEIFLALSGITEDEMMLSDEMGLSETAKELYRTGELTFAKILTDCPEVFVS